MEIRRSWVSELLLSSVDVWKRRFLSSLYSNAIYLILNSVIPALLGFVFWNLMARSFPASIVGVGSALIAATGLISSLASLGLYSGLVRFVPEYGSKGRQLVTSIFCISVVASAFTAVVFMAGARIWSPTLVFLARNWITSIGFVFISVATVLSSLIDSSFIARLASRYVFWKNLVASLVKMPLPVLVFFAFGGYGIFLGNGVSVVLALVIACFVYMPKAYADCDRGPVMNWRLVRPVLAFSFSNYLAGLFSNATGYVFPLMVLDVMGSRNSAYFYMAWMMASVVSVVPNGISTSLFAECSHHPERLSHNVKRSFWLCMVLLVPSAGMLYLIAPFLLRFFGPGYSSHGTDTLRWILLANFPLTVNSLFSTVNDVRKKMIYIVLQSFVVSGLTMGLGYLLLVRTGLPGISIGYALANLIVAMVVAIPLWRVGRGVVTGGRDF